MIDQPIPDPGLVKAVEAVGSQSALSRLIGRAQQTISDRLKAGLPLWAEDVLTIERETGVSRHDLRPDLYPRDSGAAPDHRPAPDLEPAR